MRDGEIIVTVKVCAVCSLWDAIKLRIAGAVFVREYLKGFFEDAAAERAKEDAK